jgi:hypothetical protein
VSYENFNRRLVPPWDSSRRALPRKTQEKKIVTRHAHYLALLQNRKEVKKEKKLTFALVKANHAHVEILKKNLITLFTTVTEHRRDHGLQ